MAPRRSSNECNAAAHRSSASCTASSPTSPSSTSPQTDCSCCARSPPECLPARCKTAPSPRFSSRPDLAEIESVICNGLAREKRYVARRERKTKLRQGRVPPLRWLRRNHHRPSAWPRTSRSARSAASTITSSAVSRWISLLLGRWQARRVGREPAVLGRSAVASPTDGTYPARVVASQKSAGTLDAMVTGRGTISRGLPVAFGAFNFAFMGGSMGSVVGEKITRLFERVRSPKSLPVVLLAGLRRRTHARGHPQPHADGQDGRRARALARCQAAVRERAACTPPPAAWRPASPFWAT